MSVTSVYFAECIGPNGSPMGAIKIGCSARVARRIGQLSSGQPYTCKLLVSFPGHLLDEALMHEWLRDDQISGEFFADTPAVRDVIMSARETQGMPFPVEGAEVRLADVGAGGVRTFMAMHGLTVAEAAALTGRAAVFYDAGLAQKTPPRALVASLAVAALRKGRRVEWDFDFIEPAMRHAA